MKTLFLAILLGTLALVSGTQTVNAQGHDEKSTTATRAEIWYRIYFEEWDHGQWRSAGSFENPDYERCIRQGRGWVEGDPAKRRFRGPHRFSR